MVGLDITLPEGWHTYTEPSGDAGLPPQFSWTLPPGFKAGPIIYPEHLTFSEAGLTTYGYEGHVLFPVQITPPSAIKPGEPYTLHLKGGWLVCKDICIPQETEFALTLPGAGGAEAPKSKFAKLFPSAEAKPVTHAPRGNPLLALLLALLGGIILNLMPCVFPVLSLKCLAVVRHSERSHAQARLEGLSYTAGILACFTGLAGLLIALQQGGSVVGWGYQMQSPVFVSAMALLLFMVGLSLSGLFYFPVLLGDAHASSAFFTGLLAALVATPCTAPLMAPAIGIALTQPPLIALFIFEMIGLGLALPFLLVSFFPVLLKRLPKPGLWMERLKQFLAFPMYASAVWLVWVLTQQSGPNAVGAVLLAMLFITFTFWLKPKPALLALLLVASWTATLNYVHMLKPMPSMVLALEGGEAFSETRLKELRDKGKPVFVDATAAWCITCRVNHFSTLASKEVHDAFMKKGVVVMVADWTNRDETIARYLASFGFDGVPMYVYYPQGKEPRVLPQVLTPQIVIDTLQ